MKMLSPKGSRSFFEARNSQCGLKFLHQSKSETRASHDSEVVSSYHGDNLQELNKVEWCLMMSENLVLQSIIPETIRDSLNAALSEDMVGAVYGDAVRVFAPTFQTYDMKTKSMAFAFVNFGQQLIDLYMKAYFYTMANKGFIQRLLLLHRIIMDSASVCTFDSVELERQFNYLNDVVTAKSYLFAFATKLSSRRQHQHATVSSSSESVCDITDQLTNVWSQLYSVLTSVDTSDSSDTSVPRPQLGSFYEEIDQSLTSNATITSEHFSTTDSAANFEVVSTQDSIQSVEPTVTSRRKRSASFELDDVPIKKYKSEDTKVTTLSSHEREVDNEMHFKKQRLENWLLELRNLPEGMQTEVTENNPKVKVEPVKAVDLALVEQGILEREGLNDYVGGEVMDFQTFNNTLLIEI